MKFLPHESEVAEVRRLAIEYRNKAREAEAAQKKLYDYMQERMLALAEKKQKAIERPFMQQGASFFNFQVQRYKLRHLRKMPDRIVDWEPPAKESG